MKSYEILKKIADRDGVAYVAFKLGFRDTGRVKNWILRKKVPKEFEISVLMLKGDARK